MALTNNRKLKIAIGQSSKSTHWPTSEILWSDFLKKLEVPNRTNETYEEFMKLSKSKQNLLKDVGGFVGGSFINLRRKNNQLLGRDLITLDLDNIPVEGTQDVIKKVHGLGCAYAIYSTRKHSSFTPRIRVILPLIRTITPDEYEPIARKMASLIGIGYADPTTFEPSRLMYWPSCSKDSEYVYHYSDAAFLDGQAILKMYQDWKDISTWPQVPGNDIREKRMVAKQEDPTTKRGIIGAFCNSYNVYEAIETFIPGLYEKTAEEDRYTFLGGTTFGGAIVYGDGDFLYSHHATDPISGKLCNSFDLIRIQMFGDLDMDAKEGTPNNKLPSFIEMSKFAREDDKVSRLVNQERADKLKEAFNDGLEISEEVDPEDNSWLDLLAKNKRTGEIERTINNAVVVLENDPAIKGKISLDEFSNRMVSLGPLPWNKDTKIRLWADVDDAEVMRYLETGYGITGNDKINKATLITSNRNKINEVKDYLESLVWDGKSRIDTLLNEYLGVVQNVYTADVMRKSLVGAVARAFVENSKYDYMPIFVGEQGIGKSTFMSILGGKWFNDSLRTFEGKEAMEVIQGSWIMEIPELHAMSKSEVNAVKQFLTKKDDIFREAYGKRTNKYPRRCVFFGTTNDYEFLKDPTGSRRFWPVDVYEYTPLKSIFDDLEKERDQIWAEAVMLYRSGEKLYLTGESDRIATEMQDIHRKANAKEGFILEFLETKVPENWNSLSLSARKMYLSGSLQVGDEKLILRDKICAAEIWCECFGGDIRFMNWKDSTEINSILSNLKGWTRNKGTRRYGYCGAQRGFERADIINLDKYLYNNDANKED